MKKRVLSCVLSALTMSSVFAFRVSAVTVERNNPLSVALPSQAEQIVEEALEGKTDASECVYFAPYQSYANGCIEMVTVLTPEQTYGLKTKAQENIVTVYMQPTTYATFVVYSKIDCTERLEALAGDIGEVQCLRSEEAPAQPGIAETTSSTPHTDSDGTVYPYTFTLTSLHSDASESDKALWAYTTYNALTEAADNAPKFEVWTDHGSLGTEVGHYVLPSAADWNNEGLARVPNDSFIPGYASYRSEWYYYTGDEPVQNGVPQETGLVIYQVYEPFVSLTALHSTEEAFVSAITDSFPGAAKTGTDAAKDARFVYSVWSNAYRTSASIRDTSYDIAGMETYADAFYETAKDAFDLQQYVYYRRTGFSNQGWAVWWKFGNTFDPLVSTETLAKQFSEIRAYLAENEPDWHAEEEADGTVLAICPNESIAEGVTFEEYTAVLAGITAATGYKVQAYWTELGGFEVAENGEKRYMETKTPVFGDVDGDGEVTAKDAQAALTAAGDIMAGLDSSLVSEQLTIADVDGDGEVTAKDAQYILIYAGNTNSEIACTWRSITGNPNAPDESNL